MTTKKQSKVACLAIGQGGYNGMLAMLDYDWVVAENCYYVNYAKDLAAAKLIPGENHIPLDIGDETHKDGAGKERTISKGDAGKYINAIVDQIKAKLNPAADRMFVFMSTGGGTGSGAGPTIAMFLTKKLEIPVEVIMFKPSPVNPGLEEWQSYNECLKEMNALVNAKAISLYIADLGAIGGDKDEAAIAVDKAVAELLYRYEEISCLSSKSNLDFADRKRLSSTAQVRALYKFDETGKLVTPFVLPKGQRVARVGYEVPMDLEPNVEKENKNLGLTVNDASFRGIYTDASDADPIVGFFGYTIPASLISEASDMVTELQRKSESVSNTDSIKAAGLFDNVAEHRQQIEAATSIADLGDDQLMNLIG